MPHTHAWWTPEMDCLQAAEYGEGRGQILFFSFDSPATKSIVDVFRWNRVVSIVVRIWPRRWRLEYPTNPAICLSDVESGMGGEHLMPRWCCHLIFHILNTLPGVSNVLRMTNAHMACVCCVLKYPTEVHRVVRLLWHGVRWRDCCVRVEQCMS